VTRVCQTVFLGDLRMRVTIAGLPRFESSRRTDNPLYVLSFALGMNVMLVLLFVLASVYLHVQESVRRRMLMAAEQHQRKLTEAAREAHEKTIAYACHQLR
jgi:Na+-transporting methylmalonyl-CoA/oxaloacetate decarboxylase gamma subunit